MGRKYLNIWSRYYYCHIQHCRFWQSLGRRIQEEEEDERECWNDGMSITISQGDQIGRKVVKVETICAAIIIQILLFLSFLPISIQILAILRHSCLRSGDTTRQLAFPYGILLNLFYP